MTHHDHRNEQTPVAAQENRPTCTAFAVTAAHEWMEGDLPSLSQEFALWSAKRHGCDAGREASSVHAVMRGLSLEGHCLWADWPYGRPAFPASPPTAVASGIKRPLGTWISIPRPTISRVVSELAVAAVVLTLAFVPIAWSMAQKDGVIHDSVQSTVGAHAVLAVGSLPPAGPLPTTIIIKNSWGKAWGDSGYGFLTEQYFKRHIVVATILGRRHP